MTDEPHQTWTEDLSAAERVEAVALAVSEPRTPNWIAAEAEVAHETAAKYLSRLADDGKLTADLRGQQTTYRPDPIDQYLTEMRELYDDYSPDELARSLEDITEQVHTWQSKYDVETANELRASLGSTEDSGDEGKPRLVAREWDHLVTRRRLIEDALRLHDRFPSGPRYASA